MEKFLLLNIGKSMIVRLMGPVDTITGRLKKSESGVAYLELTEGEQWVIAIDKIVAVSLQ